MGEEGSEVVALREALRLRSEELAALARKLQEMEPEAARRRLERQVAQQAREIALLREERDRIAEERDRLRRRLEGLVPVPLRALSARLRSLRG